jgi:Tol biopolymer transport system component
MRKSFYAIVLMIFCLCSMAFSIAEKILAQTSESVFHISLAWSPDGSRIAFIAGNYPNSQIYLMKPDGSNLTQLSQP